MGKKYDNPNYQHVNLGTILLNLLGWARVSRIGRGLHFGSAFSLDISKMTIDAPKFRQGSFDRPSAGRLVGP